MKHASFAALAFLFVLVALAPGAAADVIHLKNGASLQGKILSEEGEAIPIRLQEGAQVSVRRAEIAWLEWSDAAAARAELDRRRKAAASAVPSTALPAARADLLAGVGAWALLHGFSAEAATLFREALALDPGHRAAHEGLGDHLVDGRWLDEDAYMRSTGHVKHGNRWVTREEAAKLDMGWEFVDGRLLPFDEAQAAKGLVQVDGAWITKKERDERERRKQAGEKAGAAKPTEKPAPPAGAAGPAADPKEDAALLKLYGPGWRVFAGKRYRLVTNCADKDPAFDRKFVEAMDGQWAVYCDAFGVTPAQKSLHNFVLFASREEYNAWAARAAPTGRGAFGVYVHEFPYSPAFLGYRDGLRAALYTARHEGGHQFARHYLRADGAPWFVEGAGTLFEGDVPLYDYPYRWEVVRREVLTGAVGLAAIVRNSASMTAEEIYGLGALVHWFFLTGRGGAYKAGYHAFMATGATERPEALEKAVGRPLAELEKELVAFAKEMDAKRGR